MTTIDTILFFVVFCAVGIAYIAGVMSWLKSWLSKREGR